MTFELFFTNRRPWLISSSVFHSLNKYNHACQNLPLLDKLKIILITLLTFYTTAHKSGCIMVWAETSVILT